MLLLSEQPISFRFNACPLPRSYETICQPWHKAGYRCTGYDTRNRYSEDGIHGQPSDANGISGSNGA